MFNPSAYQSAVYDWIKKANQGIRKIARHLRVIAKAGSGKTTTLEHGIPGMDGRVFIGCFNRIPANELKRKLANNPLIEPRLTKWMNGKPRCEDPNNEVLPSTLHALGLGIFKSAMGKNNIAREPDGDKVFKIASKFVPIPRDFGGGDDKKEAFKYLNAVCRTVSFAKQSVFAELKHVRKDLRDFAIDIHNDDAWIEMIELYHSDQVLESDSYNRIQFVNDCRTVLIQSNEDTVNYDFDDMIYLPVAFNLKSRFHVFDWVLIDEAQDLNAARRMLAYSVLRDGLDGKSHVIMIGDPDQSCYFFAGATPDAMDVMAENLGDVTDLPLSESYRCKSRIIEEAQEIVPEIQWIEGNEGGTVRSMDYEKIIDEITAIDNYGDVAILCRNNRQLANLAFKLISRGVPARIEGRDIGKQLASICTKWKSAKSIDDLRTRIGTWASAGIARAIKNRQSNTAMNIEDQWGALKVMMDKAEEDGGTTPNDVADTIKAIYADDVTANGYLCLSTVHKAKGAEWGCVYLLGRHELMPAKYARDEISLKQESNLIYIAITRAKDELVYVNNVPRQSPYQATKASN